MIKHLLVPFLVMAMPFVGLCQEPQPAAVVKIVIEIKVFVEGAGPAPPQPFPPDPGPSPTPPDPVVPPPIPAEGLHVLFSYESEDTLTKEQQSIIYSQAVRLYLNQKCPVGPNGRTRQWRMWDKNVNGYDDSKLWGDAQKKAEGKKNWLIISNGKTGFEGPIPANVDETLTLLKKYGG